MVDASEEADSGRDHWVVVRKEKLQLKDTACQTLLSMHVLPEWYVTACLTLVAASTRTFDYHVEVAGVVVMWLGGDTRHGLVLQAFRLLDDTLRQRRRHRDESSLALAVVLLMTA